MRNGFSADSMCQTVSMVIGPVLIIVVLIAALPLVFFGMGTAIAVLLGHFLTKEGEASNEGSELIDLNV